MLGCTIYLGIIVSVSMATGFYPNPCQEDQFYCTDGFCIEKLLACDGKNDCADDSDERSCDTCSPGYFACGQGDCIGANEVCDGECVCPDCFDEEREHCFNKTSPSPCHMGQFWCSNNGCCSSILVCDGADDCGDSSDERSCDGCPNGSFSCSKGSTLTCIDPALVCDTVCDCQECEDEDENCYKESHTSPIGPIIFVVVVLGGLLVIFGMIYLIKLYMKHKEKPQSEGITSLDGLTRRPNIIGDLPGYNDPHNQNPIFIIETASLNGDADDNLPSYNDADHLRPDGAVRWFIGTPGSSRTSSFNSLHKTFSKYATDRDAANNAGLDMNAVNKMLSSAAMQVDSTSNYSYDMGYHDSTIQYDTISHSLPVPSSQADNISVSSLHAPTSTQGDNVSIHSHSDFNLHVPSSQADSISISSHSSIILQVPTSAQHNDASKRRSNDISLHVPKVQVDNISISSDDVTLQAPTKQTKRSLRRRKESNDSDTNHLNISSRKHDSGNNSLSPSNGLRGRSLARVHNSSNLSLMAMDDDSSDSHKDSES